MATTRLIKGVAIGMALGALTLLVFGAAAPTTYTPWAAFRGTNGIVISTNPTTSKVIVDGLPLSNSLAALYTTNFPGILVTNAASIGTNTTANAALQVVGDNSKSNVVQFGTTNRPSGLVMNTNGNAGIGTNIPQAKLHVNGSLVTEASITNNGLYASIGAGGSAGSLAVFNDGRATFGYDGTSVYIADGGFSKSISFSSGSGNMRFTTTGRLGIGTGVPVTTLDVTGTVSAASIVLTNSSYIPSNSAPYMVTNGTSVRITNQNQRATLFIQLAFDDSVTTTPSCSIVSTNLISTNNFGTLSPIALGLSASITNHYTYPVQTNSIVTITDTSGAGAAVRVLAWSLFTM